MVNTIVTLAFIATCLVQPSYTRKGFDVVPSKDSTLDDSWSDYKISFNKSYGSTAEEDYRRLIWEDNLALINKHNEETTLGHHSYWMGVNQFTDMTEEEFSHVMLSGFWPSTDVTPETPDNETWVTLPSSVDWRKKKLVTKVKDQGRCGSCWAFGATGSIEGQQAKKTGKLVSLSEQQLVDCSGKYHNYGCNGGYPIKAFEYVIDNGGLDTEKCYPYKAKNGTCSFNSTCVGAFLRSYKTVKVGEEYLGAAVAGVGPITVSIMATKNMQHYKSGIFTDNSCYPLRRNHAVLVVGYEPDYWIIKNSWGEKWGMQGYIHWARNKGNMCGVASRAVYPNVK